MKTRYFSSFDLEPAALLLRDSELVAFPTETVYGLGANALDPAAVKKIFEAKGRPSDNPLIVHISNSNQLEQIVREIPIAAVDLMERFWPGPLTIVFPKRPAVPPEVTAGLDTVAVRFPAHPIAVEIIRRARVPLAAPSANRSGRPSATTWQAVAEDLDGRIAGVVCSEPTMFGLESTVVDTTCSPPRVLRPGGVSLEQLTAVCRDMVPYSGHHSNATDLSANSPGTRHKHYQPRAKVILMDGSIADSAKQTFGLSSVPSERSICHYIGLHPPRCSARYARVLVCSGLPEYASQLFDFFRKADLSGADLVCCESVEEVGLGVALLDRIRRASQ